VAADIDGDAAEHTAGDITAAGGQAIGLRVDVAQIASARAMVADAVARYGGVDGLVNNAAVFSTIPISRVSFDEVDENEWDLVMNVNVKGVWNCCRAAVPALRERGGGSIVNIGSASMLHAGGGRLHYVASKAAVFGISRVLARELGPDNIRVNTVAPGNTLSEADPSPETVAIRHAAINARSLKRLQTPADLVGTVAFLLSDDSAFMTGQLLVVDGGTSFH
jgi:3-oxoacyl-[acyl-carrier protein] reductase